MFENVRKFGLCNRPAGYAQVPNGWSRVEDRTPIFAHGIIAYENSLPLRQIYSFELTPVYNSKREAAETFLAAHAEHKGKPVERSMAELRDAISLILESEPIDGWPPSRQISYMAYALSREIGVAPLGQYSSEDVYPVMLEILGMEGR